MSRGRGRQGFGLVEVLVALALVAGPLMIAATAVRSNGHHLTLLEERVTARLLLFDLMDLLSMRDMVGLRQAAANVAWVEDFLKARLQRLPASYAPVYAARIRELTRRLSLTVVEGSGLPELVRVTLSVTLANGTVVTVHRLARFPELSKEPAS
jgi:prepilin-type N-terminal cleavage/methylation domain-containing protein